MQLNEILECCVRSGEPKGYQTVRFAGGTDAWCEIVLSSRHGPVALKSGFLAVYRNKGKVIAERCSAAFLEVEDELFGALLATTVQTASNRVCERHGGLVQEGEK